MAQELDQLKQQLTEVQSQLAFQEDAMQALDAALAAQQQEILVLRRQLALLKQRQDEQAAGQGGAERLDEKPPHY